MVNKQFFYIVFPVFASYVSLHVFFHVPLEINYGALVLLLPLLALYVFGVMTIIPRMDVVNYVKEINRFSIDKYIYSFLSFVIVLLFPLDVFLNGFKLLSPSTYAEFNGYGRYVRHLTNLAWILIPVAYIFYRHSKVKYLMISLAIIMPILFIDRNRLILGCYVLLMCILIFSKKRKIDAKFFLGVVFALLIFSFVGLYRSGASFAVQSSGEYLVEGYYPLRDYFFYLPSFFQQIILYVTTPLLNFSMIFNESFINQDFLMSQLSPFNRENFAKYPYAPVLVARYNVGTEFYPFLTYGGVLYVYIAMFIMYLTFVLSYCCLKIFKNIFSLLLFFKVSYSMLLIGFAPQFFILYNLMFVCLIFILSFFSTVLKVVVMKKTHLNKMPE